MYRIINNSRCIFGLVFLLGSSCCVSINAFVPMTTSSFVTTPTVTTTTTMTLRKQNTHHDQSQFNKRYHPIRMSKESSGNNSDDNDDTQNEERYDNESFSSSRFLLPDGSHFNRRSFVSFSVSASLFVVASTTSPPPPSAKATGVFFPLANTAAGSRFEGSTSGPVPSQPVGIPTQSLSSESCLLDLLPVENEVFRTLQREIEKVSAVRVALDDKNAWKTAVKNSADALQLLDAKRNSLEPVFNEDDPTPIQITKAERGEQLIEHLRSQIVQLLNATTQQNEIETIEKQKQALLALADVGNLMVKQFPYEVPKEGKYSYLPRLLGRAPVTFVIKRDSELLGNVTIIADGFAAPITAGNFVDLSARGFYTGLPIKMTKKKWGADPFEEGMVADAIANFPGLGPKLSMLDAAAGMPAEPDDESDIIAETIPVLGSYLEGFYDPITAKLRRVPLEILKIDKQKGVAKTTYPDSLLPSSSDDVVLSFDIPGLVAMNHPDKLPNGASSEFFSLLLPKDGIQQKKAKKLDGQYAPFGYIVDGFDVMQKLKQGDVITDTFVDEWGLLNLVKIRKRSFADVMQGSSSKDD